MRSALPICQRKVVWFAGAHVIVPRSVRGPGERDAGLLELVGDAPRGREDIEQ